MCRIYAQAISQVILGTGEIKAEFILPPPPDENMNKLWLAYEKSVKNIQKNIKKSKNNTYLKKHHNGILHV